jgi:hypothetical protein
MMDLTVGFSRPKPGFKPLSWLIRAVERTPYSHVYISWFSESIGVRGYYQASGTGINFIGAKLFESQIVRVEEYILPISDQCKKNLIKFCMENSGVSYGKIQIVGIGIAKVAKAFGKGMKNPFGDGSKTQVCSELVGFILRDILEVNIPDDLDSAGPRRINEIVRGLPNARKLTG